MIRSHNQRHHDHCLFTDASGVCGCGAVRDCSCSHKVWPREWAATNIATKELVPTILAMGVWGRVWCGSHMLVRSDNMAVVEVLCSCTSQQSKLTHLLRCLHFLSARHDISLASQHIIGRHNVVADALSRNDMPI